MVIENFGSGFIGIRNASGILLIKFLPRLWDFEFPSLILEKFSEIFHCFIFSTVQHKLESTNSISLPVYLSTVMGKQKAGEENIGTCINVPFLRTIPTYLFPSSVPRTGVYA